MSAPEPYRVAITCASRGCDVELGAHNLTDPDAIAKAASHATICRGCAEAQSIAIEVVENLEAERRADQDAAALAYLERCKDRREREAQNTVGRMMKRIAHDALHAAMQRAGVRVCPSCRCLTGNRSRPMSHEG